MRRFVLESLTNKEMYEIIINVFLKNKPYQILGDSSRLVIRYHFNNKSIVVKLFNRKGLWSSIKFNIKYPFKLTTLQREWNALCNLPKHGIKVPGPLGYCKIKDKSIKYKYAIFVEDIGEHKHALDYIKHLIDKNKLTQLLAFEDNLIQFTARIIKAGYIDTDYSLINMIVNNNGELIKTDLEFISIKKTSLLNNYIYSEMIYCLIISYAYAVQPQVDMVVKFFNKLTKEIYFTPRVLSNIIRKVDRKLIIQCKESDIDTKINW